MERGTEWRVSARGRGCRLFLVCLIALFVPAPAASPAAASTPLREGDPRVFLTRDEALRIVLPGATAHRTEVRRVSPEARQRIERRAGRRMASDSVSIIVGTSGDRVTGYAFLLDEQGLHHPISFAIGLRPDGTLVDCVVMIFRESRGSEIRDPRFRRQFAGKRPTDALRINRDVINVTGATYSARAATDAIRKAMATWQECLR